MGFRDAWRETHPGDPGFTCCQADDLRNVTSQPDQRLDLILVRGDVDVLDMEIVGEVEADRTPSGLWPSDHAGVLAKLDVD